MLVIITCHHHDQMSWNKVFDGSNDLDKTVKMAQAWARHRLATGFIIDWNLRVERG